MPVGLYAGPNTYTANGVTTVFPYSFRILQSDDLSVIVAGVEQSSGYTVSGVGDSGGGNVTFTSAPANGSAVVIARDVSYDRDTDYQRNGSFDEETVDADFDRAVMQVQQVKDITDRSPKLPVGDGLAGEDFEFPAAVADGVIKWNAGASALEAVAFAGILDDEVPVSVFMATVLDDATAADARATLGIVELDQLGQIAAFLTQRHYDQRGDNHYNAMRRSIQYRKSTGLAYDDAIDVNDGDAGGETFPTGFPNTTAAAKALEFLSSYVLALPEQANQYVPVIENIASFLLSMQHKTPSTARYGGFGLAITDQTTSAFGAGVIGNALLKAWEVTHNPKYLQACVDAATYLLVCNSPNATYTSLYTETPIAAEAENADFNGFCDAIGATDVIFITSTTWNLVAADFLANLYDVVPTAAYNTVALAARDYMDHGVLNGFDYFAVKNAAPSAHVSVSWPNDGSHTYADGDWHRLGDVAVTGTVGSDQIEYGLDALYNLGYSTATLLTTYQTFRDYPSGDGGSFGAGYDGAICFTGFFRLQPDAPANIAFGSYYDLQGAGTLLYFKKQLANADYVLSRPLALLAVDRGALVDEDFDTIYSAGTGFTYYTKGVIPICNAGIGLLKSL
jgi:hypothetical protein